MIAKIKEIFSDISKEMKKVSWPTKQQLRESTLVVLGTCATITVFVWIVDVAIVLLMEKVIF
jgi:preprotein translocase subunit SecE